MEMRRRGGFFAALATAFALLVGGGAYTGLQLRWFRSPFPPPGKAIAWSIGAPESAYNFDVVVPGRLYRSGRPDERFIRYLHDVYQIQHIVTLTGRSKAHETALKLGMEVTTFEWPTDHLPPRSELEAVLGVLDAGDPVLVHCAGGSDRTGYTVVAYRVRKQNWRLEDAVEEMDRYWHDPARNHELHRELQRWLDAS